MKEQAKYIDHHKTGLPIRVAPYIRRGLHSELPEAYALVNLIQTFPVIGERNPDDIAVKNMEHNVYLRRVARKVVSPFLAQFAQERGISRYCTIVHGSLARGLVRQPHNGDASDIDMDLIIDDNTITKDEKLTFRQKMYDIRENIGVRVDCYVKNIPELKIGISEDARIYLAASGYPIANVGAMWEEVYRIGVAATEFVALNHGERKLVRKFLEAFVQGDLQTAQGIVQHCQKIRPGVIDYLYRRGVSYSPDGLTKAHNLYELCCQSRPNRE